MVSNPGRILKTKKSQMTYWSDFEPFLFGLGSFFFLYTFYVYFSAIPVFLIGCASGFLFGATGTCLFLSKILFRQFNVFLEHASEPLKSQLCEIINKLNKEGLFAKILISFMQAKREIPPESVYGESSPQYSPEYLSCLIYSCKFDVVISLAEKNVDFNPGIEVLIKEGRLEAIKMFTKFASCNSKKFVIPIDFYKHWNHAKKLANQNIAEHLEDFAKPYSNFGATPDEVCC